MYKQLEDPIIEKLQGNKPGPTVAIMVGVHGNEKGPQQQWEWLKSLQISSGTVYLIFANPTAAKLNTRFVNVNLNRRFGKAKDEYPEDRIARKIEGVLGQCHGLLDLHMYNESMDRPFVICPPNSNQLARVMPTSYVVNFPPELSSGGSDDYMEQNGKIGICFETGSVDRPEQYKDVIRAGVDAFLDYFQLTNKKAGIKPQGKLKDIKILELSSTKIVKNLDIKFMKDYSSFDSLTKGELICQEAGKEYTADQDGYILFPRPNNPVGAEAYYLLVQK